MNPLEVIEAVQEMVTDYAKAHHNELEQLTANMDEEEHVGSGEPMEDKFDSETELEHFEKMSKEDVRAESISRGSPTRRPKKKVTKSVVATHSTAK